MRRGRRRSSLIGGKLQLSLGQRNRPSCRPFSPERKTALSCGGRPSDLIVVDTLHKDRVVQTDRGKTGDCQEWFGTNRLERSYTKRPFDWITFLSVETDLTTSICWTSLLQSGGDRGDEGEGYVSGRKRTLLPFSLVEGSGDQVGWGE